MRKTFICYDKEGKEVKYLKDKQECIAAYYVKDVNEIKQYMTFEIYEKTEYVKVIRWNNKTTQNEDGSWKDKSEWKYAKTKKYYIHDLWK